MGRRLAVFFPDVARVVGFFRAYSREVSLDEIRNNGLIQSLFAPDLTIAGEPALSFAARVDAVPATYTPGFGATLSSCVTRSER